MTSKERVLAAINHRKTDRVPCGFVSTPEVDEMLKKHFKTASMDAVLENLGVDTRAVRADYVGPKLRVWDDGRFENVWGQIKKAIKNEAGTYFESVEFPYAEFETVEDVDNFRWPTIDCFDFTPVERAVEKYGDYGLIYGYPGVMDMLNGTCGGRGNEQVMIDIALQDPVGLACMQKRYDCCYQIVEKALKTGKGKIDIVWFGDDFGSQKGLLISPETWEKMFFDKIKKYCQLIHSYGAKAMLHCCGSTRVIWPRLIDAGVDIYDTVQPEAANMDFDSLYAEFGGKIALHGSISTQKTMPFGSVEDVREEVRSRLQAVGNAGGFILAPAHCLQPDTPIENILALYDEAVKGG
jgi:uroporphyrinogen decarboxylase